MKKEAVADSTKEIENKNGKILLFDANSNRYILYDTNNTDVYSGKDATKLKRMM